MAHRPRSTISPQSIAALWQRLREHDPAPVAPLGNGYRSVLTFLGWSVAVLWAILLVAAPVMLILAVLTPVNRTVEWLAAAGTVLGFSLLVLFGALVEGAVIARRTARGWRRSLPFVGLALGAIAFGLIAWAFLEPIPSPQSSFDRSRLMVMGVYLGAMIVGVLVWNGLRASELPWFARGCSIVAGLMFGVSTTLASADLAYDLYDRLPWSHERNWISALQWGAFVVYYLGQITARQPRPQTRRWLRVILAALLGAGVLFGVLWVWLLGIGRR